MKNWFFLLLTTRWTDFLYFFVFHLYFFINFYFMSVFWESLRFRGVLTLVSNCLFRYWELVKCKDKRKIIQYVCHYGKSRYRDRDCLQICIQNIYNTDTNPVIEHGPICFSHASCFNTVVDIVSCQNKIY